MGIYIDKGLMNNHVDSIHRHCMTKLRMQYKIHGFICQNTALLMHEIMIHPNMVYCNFIIDSVHISKIDILDHLQEHIVRLIQYCPTKENREEITVLLNWYNLEVLKTRRKKKYTQPYV